MRFLPECRDGEWIAARFTKNQPSLAIHRETDNDHPGDTPGVVVGWIEVSGLAGASFRGLPQAYADQGDQTGQHGQ